MIKNGRKCAEKQGSYETFRTMSLVHRRKKRKGSLGNNFLPAAEYMRRHNRMDKIAVRLLVLQDVSLVCLSSSHEL